MKRLLVVVDFQNDFIDGSLGFPGAEALEGPIVEKINEYESQGDEVVFTRDVHPQGYLQTQEGRLLPVEHCLEGTAGAQFYGRVADLAAAGGHRVFDKQAFGSMGLLGFLADRQKQAAQAGGLPFSSIELVGVVSNICVLANAVAAKTACPEVPVIVDAACTGSGDAALHEKGLDVMTGLQVLVRNR